MVNSLPRVRFLIAEHKMPKRHATPHTHIFALNSPHHRRAVALWGAHWLVTNE